MSRVPVPPRFRAPLAWIAAGLFVLRAPPSFAGEPKKGNEPAKKAVQRPRPPRADWPGFHPHVSNLWMLDDQFYGPHWGEYEDWPWILARAEGREEAHGMAGVRPVADSALARIGGGIVALAEGSTETGTEGKSRLAFPAFLACVRADVAHGEGWVALARVARHPATGDAIAEAARDAAASSLEPESWPPREDGWRAGIAALALGFLGRPDPSLRFSPEDYDRWRDALFALADDARMDRELRARATYAIGLLGDMPTRRARGDTAAARLLASIRKGDSAEWVARARWLALSSQAPDTVPADAIAAARDAAFAVSFAGRRLQETESSAAAMAFARIVAPEDLPAFLSGTVTRPRSGPTWEVVGALGERAPDLPADVRRAIEAAIGATLDRSLAGPRDSRLLVLLGRLLEGDAREGVPLAAGGTQDHAVERLFGAFASRVHRHRACAALASGWLLVGIGDRPDSNAWAVLRDRVLVALRGLADDGATFALERAAAVTALGSARSLDDEVRFVRLLGDAEAPVYARSRAAWALGLLSAWRPGTTEALRREADLPFWDVLSQSVAVALARSPYLLDGPRRRALVAECPPAFGRTALSRAAGRWSDLGLAQAFVEQASDLRADECARWMAMTALAEWADPDRRSVVDRVRAVCGAGASYWGVPWDDEDP